MTAYEMRMSDWSSDVCSSDLSPIAASPNSATTTLAITGAAVGPSGESAHAVVHPPRRPVRPPGCDGRKVTGRGQATPSAIAAHRIEIGRASGREREGRAVEIWGVAVA